MTLGSHQRTVGKSQTHLTPREFLDALGQFDLDPCAAFPRPWDCARVNWSVTDDGLSRQWFGRVWCNPPFDSRIAGQWVRRMAAHRHGILLIHARTETMWFRPIWEGASAILFLHKRVKFLDQQGIRQKNCSGAPVVLAAFGDRDAKILAGCGLAGTLVTEWSERRSAFASLAA